MPSETIAELSRATPVESQPLSPSEANHFGETQLLSVTPLSEAIALSPDEVLFLLYMYITIYIMYFNYFRKIF